MDLLVFVAVLSFTIVYSYVESRHDVNVILNDNGYNNYSKRWHFFGLIQNFLAFLPLTIWLWFWNWHLAFNLTIMMGFLFWQLHDSIIGYGLTKNIFHLGTTGSDKWFSAVFQNGKTFAFIRMSIVTVVIYDYFRTLYF